MAPCMAASDADAVIDPDRACRILIDYKEDIEGSDPVIGAGFTAYRIAALNEYGGYEMLNGLPEPDADDPDTGSILNTVRKLIDKDPECMDIYRTVTDQDGLGAFLSVRSGLYIIEETYLAAGHFASEPCLIQVPYTEDNVWVYERKAEPKARPAGNLLISKTVRSTRGDHKDQEFHFQVILEGITDPVHYIKGKEDGYIRSGDSIALKDGESVMLEMIPAGTAYRVYELEADAGEFLTTFTGAEGHISRKDIAVATFINTQLPPPTGDVPLEYITAGISLISLGSACMLIFRLRKI